MTAIASFRVAGCPALLGDLIISGYENPNRRAGLPTIGDVTNFFPEGSGWTITGLSQKVALISDDCAVTWAGSKLGAQIATTQLRALAKQAPLTKEVIQSFLAKLDPDVTKLGTTLLGFVRDGDDFFQFSLEPEHEFVMPDGSSAHSAGTGGKHLKDFLQSHTRTRAWGDENTVHPAQRAYETGLMLGGSLLRTERPLGYTLREYYGGGYEIAVFNGERFTKDTSATFILWDAREHDEKGFAHPTRVISYQYDGDFLLVRAQELKISTPGHFTFGEVSFGTVNPIYSNAQYPKELSPSLFTENTHWICHCFLVSRGGKLQPFPLIERCYPDPAPFTTIDTQNGIITAINTKGTFWTTIATALERWPASENFPKSSNGTWGLVSDV
jgi:hypothetical protein